MCTFMAFERSVGNACAHIIQMQIEQCLTMQFDKPNTIALVTSYLWKIMPLNKQVLYLMVQLGNQTLKSLCSQKSCQFLKLTCWHMQFGKRLTDKTYYFSEAIGPASRFTIPMSGSTHSTSKGDYALLTCSDRLEMRIKFSSTTENLSLDSDDCEALLLS